MDTKSRLTLHELKDRPELTAAIARAVAAYDAMTPAQKREHRAAQAKSWVVGEMMIEHPEMTREEVEHIYDEIAH